MRAETQKKFDKVQKLISKGYKPTVACKETGLAYNVYKKNLITEKIPTVSEYIKVKNTCNELEESINLLEMNQRLSEENNKLRLFIKEFL